MSKGKVERKQMKELNPETKDVNMKKEDISQDMPDKEESPGPSCEKEQDKDSNIQEPLKSENTNESVDRDLKIIKSALNLANQKGAFNLEESYIVASAVKRIL